MNAQRREWTDLDFESLSWHDNQIHALRLRNPREAYDFDVLLDIDHILKWIESPDGTFRFLIAPAILTFHNVLNLDCRFALTYKEHITISRIDREGIVLRPGGDVGPRWYRWRVHLQPDASGPGLISFEATGFTLKLTKDPIESSCSWLEDDQR